MLIVSACVPRCRWGTADDTRCRARTDTWERVGNPHLAYEAEAIGQGPIEELMRQRLDELIPEPLEVFLEREVRERAEVVKLLKRRK
jgi:hypothetical protein